MSCRSTKLYKFLLVALPEKEKKTTYWSYICKFFFLYWGRDVQKILYKECRLIVEIRLVTKWIGFVTIYTLFQINIYALIILTTIIYKCNLILLVFRKYYLQTYIKISFCFCFVLRSSARWHLSARSVPITVGTHNISWTIGCYNLSTKDQNKDVKIIFPTNL